MICGSGGSKTRHAKVAGAEPCGQMRDENLHAVMARSAFTSQHQIRTTFGRWDVEKRPPVWREARVQEHQHFWKFWCRKRARRRGAKHISKANMLKTSSQVASNPLGDHFRTQIWVLKWNLQGGSYNLKWLAAIPFLGSKMGSEMVSSTLKKIMKNIQNLIYLMMHSCVKLFNIFTSCNGPVFPNQLLVL